MPVEEVAVGRHARRHQHRFKGGMIESKTARRDAERAEQAYDQAGQPDQRFRVAIVIAAADIHMHQSRTDAGKGCRGLADLSKHEIARLRQAGLVRRGKAVEGDDAAARKPLAQMIVGAAIAESEFDDRTGRRRDFAADHVEDVALRRQPTDEAVQPAHSTPVPPTLRAGGMNEALCSAGEYPSVPGRAAWLPPGPDRADGMHWRLRRREPSAVAFSLSSDLLKAVIASSVWRTGSRAGFRGTAGRGRR